MKKLTNEEFLTKLRSIHGEDYTPLEDYKGVTKLMNVKHNVCGRIYETTPDKLYSGGCSECGYIKTKTKQRKTNEQFKQEVFNLTGDEYLFLEDYVNTGTKLKVTHTKCNHTYTVTPRDFLSGRRCPNCKGERISKGVTKNHAYFVGKLGDDLGDEYELLSKYENSRTKLTVHHTVCGLTYQVSPHHLLNGKRCPECWKESNGLMLRKSNAQFVKELGTTWLEDYELLSEYVKQTVKVKVKHKRCGCEFEVIPDSLLRGSGCPHCNESRGEQQVRTWLIDNDIAFIPQMRFDDCVYVGKLSYDFALIEQDSIIGLIEYQGIQHHRPVDFFGGELVFEKQQIKDDIKRKYAEEKNIPLYEVNYFDNVEQTLSTLIPR